MEINQNVSKMFFTSISAMLSLDKPHAHYDAHADFMGIGVSIIDANSCPVLGHDLVSR